MNIAIVLAAGEGTRMKSTIAKPMHKVCEKPMLEHILLASDGANIEKKIIIVGHGEEEIRDYFKERDLIFKRQEFGENVPYGTGYAVLQAIDEIDDEDTVLILFGDTPLIKNSTIDSLLNFHKEGDFHGTVLTAEIDEPFGYGRILRDEEGLISRIVEEKEASQEEKKIKEINSGIFSFRGHSLKKALKEVDSDNSKGEIYLTDVIEILNNKGHKLGAFLMDNPEEILGVNSKRQLAASNKIMRERINNYHMDQGVILIDPQATYISSGAKIGMDTVIYPGSHIEGDTIIGEKTIIRSASRIVDSQIGDGVIIESSLIEESSVGDNTSIGPNAHLRPNCKIGKNIKIGNFVEVKNSTMEDNTKAGHLAYIGDAHIGENTNIGCGVIFVNYDGKNKKKSIVGKNAFIGSNVNIVSPVKINDWAFVAAGTTVTKEVEEGALSIGRVSQVNKKGWAEKKGFKNTNK